MDERYCADCGAQLPPRAEWVTLVQGLIEAAFTVVFTLFGAPAGQWESICNQCAGEDA